MGLMLAQGGSATVSVLAWAGALIAALILAGAVLMILHKKLLGRGADGPSDEGLMDSLRRMRDSGEMSREEFDAAKRTIARKSVEAMEARRVERETQAKRARAGGNHTTPDNEEAT